jgi:hypothetical protein
MKKTMVSLMLLSSLGLSSVAFAENATVYYPDNSPVVGSQISEQGKTRAQVKQELIQAEKSGEMKHLDQTVFVGH